MSKSDHRLDTLIQDDIEDLPILPAGRKPQCKTWVKIMEFWRHSTAVKIGEPAPTLESPQG